MDGKDSNNTRMVPLYVLFIALVTIAVIIIACIKGDGRGLILFFFYMHFLLQPPLLLVLPFLLSISSQVNIIWYVFFM